MSGARMSAWPAVLPAFSGWFAHFIVCWAATEIWPGQWAANIVAWVATAVALLALQLHGVRLNAQQRPAWQQRFAQRAGAVASVAVLFGALPSLVLLPAA